MLTRCKNGSHSIQQDEVPEIWFFTDNYWVGWVGRINPKWNSIIYNVNSLSSLTARCLVRLDLQFFFRCCRNIFRTKTSFRTFFQQMPKRNESSNYRERNSSLIVDKLFLKLHHNWNEQCTRWHRKPHNHTKYTAAQKASQDNFIQHS